MMGKVEIEEEVEGDRTDYYLERIGESIKIKDEDSQYDLENPPSQPFAISERHRVVFIAHSSGFLVGKTKDVISASSEAMGTKGMNEFQAEIALLTKVRHRHLVALLGYCVNGDERLLVYEYMPQGNLGQHLFEYEELGYSPLTWKQRVSIDLDVARGVEYLHSFIHRDLKPSNILLGDDMRAKVADFGLVKNAPDGRYSVETRLAGTFGYLAPEYADLLPSWRKTMECYYKHVMRLGDPLYLSWNRNPGGR